MRKIHICIARPLVVALVVGMALLLLQARESRPALAVHHIAEISEVMSGFDGDPNVQYVEIDQLTAYQNVVTNTRLTAFNANGTLAGVLLDPVGGNVGAFGDRWIMGTAAFELASGISADFVFSPGILPSAGMVCWGAPGVSAPLDPNTWDASDPNNYVDCVSYGGASFTGTNPMSPNPNSAGAGDGTMSLTRNVPSTGKVTNPWRNSDDATAFKLANPSPTNDAGQVGSLVASATATPTATPTPTPAGLTPTPTPDISDTDGDGCSDERENGPDETQGGLRDFLNPWDFYDTNGDGVIDLFNDILGVILHYSLDGSPPYDVDFDRGPTAGPNPWNMTAPDGVIDLFVDILGVINQHGHTCV